MTFGWGWRGRGEGRKRRGYDGSFFIVRERPWVCEWERSVGWEDELRGGEEGIASSGDEGMAGRIMRRVVILEG